MKKYLFYQLLILIFVSIGVYSCNNKKSNLPELAIAEFNKIYPDAKTVKWNYNNDSIWEVEFKLGEKVMIAEFNKAGIWLQSSTNISPDLIPQVVIDKMDGFYYGYAITTSVLVERPDLKGYAICIEVNSQMIDLLITETGELRKAQAAKTDSKK